MENSNGKDFNRSFFIKLILPKFIAAYISNSDIEAAYNDCISKLSNDTNLNSKIQNDERRKILENCLTLFTDVDLKKELDLEMELLKRKINKDEHRTGDFERAPSLGELTNRFLSVFSEKLLGDNKRKYDMSCKYNSSIIASRKAPNGSIIKGVKVASLQSTNIPSWDIQDDYGRTISLHLIGTLAYLNSFGVSDYLGQFRVNLSKNNLDEDEYIVYTNIDFDKIGTDPTYTGLVAKELLSKNNIELSNAGGYIGEIVNTKYEDTQIDVGKESGKKSGVYRYQISPEYALMYNSEHLSAVVDYVEQQKSISEQISKKDTNSR